MYCKWSINGKRIALNNIKRERQSFEKPVDLPPQYVPVIMLDYLPEAYMNREILCLGNKKSDGNLSIMDAVTTSQFAFREIE